MKIKRTNFFSMTSSLEITIPFLMPSFLWRLWVSIVWNWLNDGRFDIGWKMVYLLLSDFFMEPPGVGGGGAFFDGPHYGQQPVTFFVVEGKQVRCIHHQIVENLMASLVSHIRAGCKRKKKGRIKITILPRKIWRIRIFFQTMKSKKFQNVGDLTCPWGVLLKLVHKSYC